MGRHKREVYTCCDDDVTLRGYEMLAGEIVARSVTDFNASLNYLYANLVQTPKRKGSLIYSNISKFRETQAFLTSDWCDTLCTLALKETCKKNQVFEICVKKFDKVHGIGAYQVTRDMVTKTEKIKGGRV